MTPDQIRREVIADLGRSTYGLLCGAKTRAGGVCQREGMKNGRRYMHGGKSPGAPLGNRNAWKHGRYSRVNIPQQ